MASLANIPTELLHRTKYMSFLNWVFKYPLGWSDTRHIIQVWSHRVLRTMTAADWSAIETRWLHRNARP